jgi:hypothetical protein
VKDILRKYPVEYELTPKKLEKGTHWISLKLTNIGTDPIMTLDVQLHSLDTSCISVMGLSKFIADLKPRETEVVPFQVNATRNGKLYVTVNAFQKTDPFYWISTNIPVRVGRETAELTYVFAMTEPYPTAGSTIAVEAKVTGHGVSENLKIEFWADTPSDEFEELGKIKTKPLNAGESSVYRTEITPKETGQYTIHAYLYDNRQLIGHEQDIVWVNTTI